MRVPGRFPVGRASLTDSDTKPPSKLMLSSRSFSLPAVPLGALIACILISLLSISVSKPWPLVVIFSDLHRLSGASANSYNLVAFLVSFFSALAGYILGWALGKRSFLHYKGSIGLSVGYAVSAGMICAAAWTYPAIKGYLAAREFGRASGAPVILYLARNAEYEHPKDHIRALLVTSQQDQPFTSLPVEWPFSFVKPGNSLIVTISEERLELAVKSLKEDGFFQLPEQLDPRPVLDHAVRYVAIARDDDFCRAFGRLSDDGFEHLWDVGEGLVERLNLKSDWWKAIPGRIEVSP